MNRCLTHSVYCIWWKYVAIGSVRVLPYNSADRNTVPICYGCLLGVQSIALQYGDDVKFSSAVLRCVCLGTGVFPLAPFQRSSLLARDVRAYVCVFLLCFSQFRVSRSRSVPAPCQAFKKMNNVLIDDRRIRVDFSQSVSKEW